MKPRKNKKFVAIAFNLKEKIDIVKIVTLTSSNLYVHLFEQAQTNVKVCQYCYNDLKQV